MFDKMHLYDTKIMCIDNEGLFDILNHTLSDMGNHLHKIKGFNEIMQEYKIFLPEMVLINLDIKSKKELEEIDRVCTILDGSYIVLVTAADKKEYYEQLMQYINLRVIPKPLNIDFLLELLGTKAKFLKMSTSLSIESQFNSMADMIRNISHQWRQPLNRLSGLLMNLYAASEFDKLDKKLLNEKLEMAEKTLKYLSHTIEDFKRIYTNTRLQENFSIEELVSEAMQMSSAHLEGYIKSTVVVRNSCRLYGYKKELFQALLNIFQNSKEQFKWKDISNPQIQVSIDKHNNFCYVTIEDNAGGIELQPIEQIFYLYKTSKKDQGTGLGLYMSKMIIEQKMKGKITASNIQNGARFSISLPLSNQS
ncbi:MAG: sensor histidine kinase [Campylobacterota bacterium]